MHLQDCRQATGLRYMRQRYNMLQFQLDCYVSCGGRTCENLSRRGLAKGDKLHGSFRARHGVPQAALNQTARHVQRYGASNALVHAVLYANNG